MEELALSTGKMPVCMCVCMRVCARAFVIKTVGVSQFWFTARACLVHKLILQRQIENRDEKKHQTKSL